MSRPMPPSPQPPRPPVVSDPAVAGTSPTPRSLDAGAGVSWIGEGWQIFTAAPGTWIGITLIFLLVMVALGFIPLVGMLAHQLLAPVFVGGVILGCHALARGEPLTVSHLFDAFKAPHMSPLMVFGLINLAISFVVTVVFALIFVLAVGLGSIEELMTGDPIQMGTVALMRVGIAGLIALPLAMLAVTVLVMLWWFAPPLIVQDGLAPWDAMKASFRGCLMNILPFLLYGIVMLALAFVASLPLMLGWLVLVPVAMGSQYASWRQVFSRAT